MGCGNPDAGEEEVALQLHCITKVSCEGSGWPERVREVEFDVGVPRRSCGLRGGSCSALEGREAEQRGRGVSWGARELRGAGN